MYKADENLTLLEDTISVIIHIIGNINNRKDSLLPVFIDFIP